MVISLLKTHRPEWLIFKFFIILFNLLSGHCKKMEPVYIEVGKYYKGHPMVTVAKVDATRFVKAAEHFEVKGYPTIL